MREAKDAHSDAYRSHYLSLEMSLSIIRQVGALLPEQIKRLLRPAVLAIEELASMYSPRSRWVSNVYFPFGREERERLLLGIMRFCNINRPIPGYYFEFGCHSGSTMTMAWRHSRYLFDWQFVAFDSFEGLPEVEGIDKAAIFKKGKLDTSEDAFIEIVTRVGMPRSRLRTVKGFYDRSLTPELAASLAPHKAAVVYIDCDLYMSTVPVLEFVRGFLQLGTIIVFDDWFCYHGRTDRGEQLAFREFCDRYPDLEFVPFVQTSEAKSFIFVGYKETEKLSPKPAS